MDLLLEAQRNLVRDETTAIVAVVRPILLGILCGLKKDVVDQVGGYEQARLSVLARLRRPGDGDLGVCFEYAVHDAIKRAESPVVERVADALKLCRVPGNSVTSILFGVEKTGSQRLIDTAQELLTPNSDLLHGAPGRPVKLWSHLDTIVDAMHRPAARQTLPQSIAGLWKADLFLGRPDTDKWVATTLKVNRDELEPAPGLRIGIVPGRETRGRAGLLPDSVFRDDSKNLVICPLPYDGSFMDVFYQAWNVVANFLAADAQLPASRTLPFAASRHVAKLLEAYRNHTVLDVVAGLGPMAQPHLLDEHRTRIEVVETAPLAQGETRTLLAPIPCKI